MYKVTDCYYELSYCVTTYVYEAGGGGGLMLGKRQKSQANFFLPLPDMPMCD